MPGDGPAKDLDLPSQTASWLISYNDYRLLRAAANTSSSNVEGGGDIEALALKLPKKRKLESAVSAEEMDILNLEEVGLIRYCDVIHVCFGDDAMRTACSEAAQRPPGIEKKHWRVAATAIAYFRRFYLVNSLVKFDPRTIMIACAYLAGKTEECRVGVTELLTVHPKATRDIVLAHERIIIQVKGKSGIIVLCLLDVYICIYVYIYVCIKESVFVHACMYLWMDGCLQILLSIARCFIVGETALHTIQSRKDAKQHL
jgi:hypothetical protein